MYLNYNKKLKIFVEHDGLFNKQLLPTSSLKETDRPLIQK
jgi:hypothetical protein